MNCPTCEKAMSFVPSNQNWWCNRCLAAVEGAAPAGLSGPSASQIELDRHTGTPVPERNRGFDVFDVLDAAAWLSLVGLVSGGVLIYSGATIVGVVVIAIALGAFLVLD